jgi:hypothetical protein
MGSIIDGIIAVLRLPGLIIRLAFDLASIVFDRDGRESGVERPPDRGGSKSEVGPSIRVPPGVAADPSRLLDRSVP